MRYNCEETINILKSRRYIRTVRNEEIVQYIISFFTFSYSS